jgi:hypothetical protein
LYYFYAQTSKELTTSELYCTAKGRSSQCDLTNTLYIEFKEYTWKFSLRDFLLFRNYVRAVDLKELIFDLSDESDVVSLHHARLATTYTLTLCDLIQLRELVDGTKFSLELVSMIHEVLGDYAVV